MTSHSLDISECPVENSLTLAGNLRVVQILATLWLCAVQLACGGSNAVVEQQSALTESGAKLERCAVISSIPRDQHMITSWKTAPGDALITHPITQLTVRQSFAPHWDGELIRLRLTNRYASLPITFENVHIAQELTPGGAEMQPGTACPLSFAGAKRITIAPGESVLSDTIAYPLRAFERVGISFFAPEASLQISRHLNANEYLYMSQPGDYSADPNGAAFYAAPEGYTSNFLGIEALEVAAPRQVHTLVAVGDSITDGSSSTTAFLSSNPSSMMASDQRYPNHLQRVIHAAGLPISVANAGIGGNELLNNGWLPQFGLRMLDRLDQDVLAVTGASHVLAMIGTNDFGNPKAGPTPTAEDLIAGLTQLIERVQAADMRIVLATIPPAEGTITAGLIGEFPLGVMHGSAAARQSRDAVNDWIRQQQLSDGVVDFAHCLEDPERPGYLAPEYNSGDNLHPNPAGYAAMAHCVDLQLFL
ncbi:MAG: GDSL-type esterase/lipase family protein [Oceanococcus sp.]